MDNKIKILEKIEKDFKEALAKKEKEKISVLKLLKSAIHNYEIELRATNKKLTEDEIIKIIKKEAKKREEAMKFYEGKRDDLFEKEKKELEILKKYLPEEISDDELIKIIRRKIDLFGLTNFGKIMGEVMKEVGNKADGKRVAELVKKELEK
jgi:uncharacterized protein YqeY